jgi:hypothetical protein
MPEIKPGSRWRSTTCTTEVVVVKAPPGEADLECGGQAMVAHDAEVTELGTPAPGADEGTLVGKRYVDGDATIEVLCTKAGAGSLSLGGTALAMKDAKPLPASD